MKAVIIGQQDFGKAVLEAFLDRQDEVVGVFCAPEKEGARPDPLRVAAQEKGIRVIQLPSLKTPEAIQVLRELAPEIGVMAYVLQFVPQEFVTIPTHGMIQYHPSLLPRYRGPSSINWPILRGDRETGLTVFRPTDGLDEGPIILQKKVPIGPEDTLGSLYFDHLFPLGVQALLEATDQILAGTHQEMVQDEELASYEGWCRSAESEIHWAQHVTVIHDLIRGCNPAPGAWTLLGGKKLQIFEVRKHLFRTFGAVRGKVGEISGMTDQGFLVTVQGGQIEILRVKLEGGKKVDARPFAEEQGLQVGMRLGTS
ncbi:methionyl-tRNA formyltransferase [Ferrovum myxofaciens]|jgi:methionyl-tRNA formyltransferase|uniref:Methionyl-tRNA formyltransferase n=3 Tax=root TaxID=1 RepID=A0A859A8V1_9PROT|nr:methionyl-tRNA formyltransferase [Ferrovum myxofaciens]MBW8028952.1 methionyl-tRNA formyltransferase [Ferrovum sp.]KXW58564.1 methionyl-tRNA formyltransferase [Ferrovum myxofaciens]MBU6994613.1 methionyl-tRNA formyltransferase [Ferrovum myxofaciens]NDU90756.1 methionyl-tRNA formyltransferase [Ferrovum sp.]QKE38472.1 MAG: methionyl-tRNA formyltransferase [Ferrovum myxofaciens]